MIINFFLYLSQNKYLVKRAYSSESDIIKYISNKFLYFIKKCGSNTI